MSFRRIPKEIDPRRPPKRRQSGDASEQGGEARSYGQYVDTTAEEIEEFEDLTGEVAREGDSGPAPAQRPREGHDEDEEREEFEELAGEPLREDGEA